MGKGKRVKSGRKKIKKIGGKKRCVRKQTLPVICARAGLLTAPSPSLNFTPGALAQVGVA